MQLQIGITAETPLPDPIGANFFHFTLVGTELQLLIGSINLLQMHEIKTNPSGKSHTLIPHVSHRFLMSPFGFAQLKAQVDGLADKVPAAGIGITAGVK